MQDCDKEIVDDKLTQADLIKLMLHNAQHMATREEVKSDKLSGFITEFNDYLFDDLNTPRALATMWTVLKVESLSAEDKLKFILNADEVFSLGLKELIEAEETAVEIPTEIQALLDERAQARTDKEWAKSDEIRDKIADMGYTVKDSKDGQEITKK